MLSFAKFPAQTAAIMEIYASDKLVTNVVGKDAGMNADEYDRRDLPYGGLVIAHLYISFRDRQPHVSRIPTLQGCGPIDAADRPQMSGLILNCLRSVRGCTPRLAPR